MADEKLEDLIAPEAEYQLAPNRHVKRKIEDGKVIITRTTDVSDLLDYNAAMRNERTGPYKFIGNDKPEYMHPVASLDWDTAMYFKNTFGLDIMKPGHAEEILKIIDKNPDFKNLKTVDAKLT